MKIEGLVTIHSGKTHYAPGVPFNIGEKDGMDLVSRGFAVKLPEVDLTAEESGAEVDLGDSSDQAKATKKK